MPGNPLGVMEDPVKAMVVEALALLGRDFIVRSVELSWGHGELRITVTLRPRRGGVTVSTWRLLELEERIAARLGLDPELSHSRVGVTEEGLLLLTYTYRAPGIEPPRVPED